MAAVGKSKKLAKNIKTGAEVLVISGKYKGKKANVVKVNKDRSRVYLEGINLQTDYKKDLLSGLREKTQKLGSVHVSNVKLTGNFVTDKTTKTEEKPATAKKKAKAVKTTKPAKAKSKPDKKNNKE
jgi:large subunit ribosomal protein L24